VNRLKLAQEFVFRVTVDYRNAAVVRASIRLAHELGLEVIAEGVETEAQMRFLIGAGCEQARVLFQPPGDGRPCRRAVARRPHRAERGVRDQGQLKRGIGRIIPSSPSSLIWCVEVCLASARNALIVAVK
jgi:predicted signal transduction protein with EAL and GGDEF domain